MRFTVKIEGQPPSGNRQHINVLRRSQLHAVYMGRAKAPEVESYQQIVVAKVKEAMPSLWNPGPYLPAKGKGMIFIRLWLYLGRDVDADNVLKPLFDGVKWGLGTTIIPPSRKAKMPRVAPYYDDARFLPQVVSKITGFAEPYVMLELDDGQ